MNGRVEAAAVARVVSLVPTPAAELRILIGLTEISGYACNLLAGFRELGVRADLLDLQPAGARFSNDAPPTRLMRLLQRVSRARLATPTGNRLRRRSLAGAQILLQPLALVQAIRRYNTFVFLYDTAFLRQRELPLLKLLGKRVVYVFCGSDDRPSYLDGGIMSPEGGVSIEECIADVAAKQRMLRRVERHADLIIAGPPRGLLHRRPFVSFPTVGIPRVPHEGPSEVSPAGPPKIVHAPTHAAAKGSAVIRMTLERLRARGFEFEYVELQGVANSVVREHLRTCAFVIDQVWADTAMCGVVADAALYGKPSIVSGYGWDEVQRVLPRDALAPSERCSPEGLEAAIVKLLTDEPHRRELGLRAQAFVTNRWSASAVAQRFLDLLEGPPPPDWVHDPFELRYVLGWGQSVERSIELVRAIVARGGTEALGLGDKIEAQQALLDLAFDPGAVSVAA